MSFKKGDRVLLSKESRFFDDGRENKKDGCNPFGVEGVIIDIEYSPHRNIKYYFEVKWDNGILNQGYNIDDLELVKTIIKFENENPTVINVGDIVRIKASSIHYGYGLGRNPRDVNGVVVENQGDGIDYDIKVSWNDSDSEEGWNDYRKQDLVIVKSFVEPKNAIETKVESIIESKSESKSESRIGKLRPTKVEPKPEKVVKYRKLLA